MQWAVRRVNLLFPLCTSSLIFYPPSVRPWETHLSTRCSTRFSSRLNLFLLRGPMRALVCRSLPHAGGGSPRQLPHLPSKALIEIPVLFSPPPSSSCSLSPPSPPPPLHS